MLRIRFLITFAFTSQLTWLNSYSKSDSTFAARGRALWIKQWHEQKDATEKGGGYYVRFYYAVNNTGHEKIHITSNTSHVEHVCLREGGFPLICCISFIIFPNGNNWHFCLWSSVWSLWTLARALQNTLVKHMMSSLHSCPGTSAVSPLNLYSHKQALSCKFCAISSINIPRDIHLILTSSAQLIKCRLENKWQTPKQINYVSTKLLARVHRSRAGNKSWHTLPYGLCESGHRSGDAVVQPWNSHTYLCLSHNRYVTYVIKCWRISIIETFLWLFWWLVLPSVVDLF